MGERIIPLLSESLEKTKDQEVQGSKPAKSLTLLGEKWRLGEMKIWFDENNFEIWNKNVKQVL